MAASLFPVARDQEQPRHLLEFKAGRLFRDGNTHWVRPDERRGIVYLDRPDGLLHFNWKDRAADQAEEDLIIFPEDAEFFPVTQANGRVYALKFQTSGMIQFFWMQSSDPDNDSQLCQRVNELIAHSDEQENMTDQEALMQMLDYEINEEIEAEPQQAPRESSSSTGTATGAATATGTATTTATTTTTTTTTTTAAAPTGQLGDLRRLLASISVSPTGAPDLQLGDVLTPENVGPLLNDQELCQALFPHLPEGAPHTADEIREVVGSPQFQQSLQSLSAALASGQLAPLVVELGLPPEAGTGVENFLRAIERRAQDRAGGGEPEQETNQSNNEGDNEQMDED